MSKVKNFFDTMMMVIVFFVILVIFGIGYKTFFQNAGHSTSAMANMQENPNSQQASTNTTGQTPEAVNTNNATPQQQANIPAPSYAATAVSQSDVILKNKANLEIVISKLNDTMRYLTSDPYAPGENSDVNDDVDDTNSEDSQEATKPDSIAMQNMGQRYDANKMEQLHAGIYKIAIGATLLDQLNDELATQSEHANLNIADPAQYYTNHYNLAIQNKSKLSEALNYISEAANLVNINPYVSNEGLQYDKDRMGQLHHSVFKLAESVAAISLLDDNFTKQSVDNSTMLHNYITALNNAKAASSADTQASHVAPASNTGIFDNIDAQSIVNILLLVFAASFILGILGYILHLAKSQSKPKLFEAES